MRGRAGTGAGAGPGRGGGGGRRVQTKKPPPPPGVFLRKNVVAIAPLKLLAEEKDQFFSPDFSREVPDFLQQYRSFPEKQIWQTCT